MPEDTSEDGSKSVNAEVYKASSILELDEIRKLDLQLHRPNITFQEQQDAETKLNNLFPKLSEKFGIPREEIMDRLREERRLQAEVDRTTRELVSAKQQSETIIRTGARPPEPGTSGPTISTTHSNRK